MPIAAKILTELLPLSVEVFLGEASPGRILTGLTLFNLANTCIVAGGLLSRSARYRAPRLLLTVFVVWLLVCLSILLWVFAWVILHQYGGT